MHKVWRSGGEHSLKKRYKYWEKVRKWKYDKTIKFDEKIQRMHEKKNRKTIGIRQNSI